MSDGKPSGRNAPARASHRVSQADRDDRSIGDSVPRDRFACPEAFRSILTHDPEFRRILLYLDSVAGTDQSVLVTGETGTGKELVARAVHDASRRRGRFVTVNVAGTDETMFTDTLFGHHRGAFTGAESSRAGLVELAEEGTLFLDEIAELSAVGQARLLRFLQEREYLPLGADRPERSTARIVAASSSSVSVLRKSDSFRQDLFFRLCAHHVHLPPLRHRPLDLPLLVDAFIDEAAEAMGLRSPAYPPELLLLLATSDFPGNVRQLRSLVFDAVADHRGGVLGLGRFCARLDRHRSAEGAGFPSLVEAETWLLREALRRSAGNRSHAAKMLGISRQALQRKLRNLRLEGEVTDGEGA